MDSFFKPSDSILFNGGFLKWTPQKRAKNARRRKKPFFFEFPKLDGREINFGQSCANRDVGPRQVVT
jgi:hypothetical protein